MFALQHSYTDIETRVVIQGNDITIATFFTFLDLLKFS